MQHRGVPATHDVKTGAELFKALSTRQSNIRVPSYDKSQYNGAGDRRPENEWQVVNKSGDKTVEVIVLEGWCVGFRALDDEQVQSKWRAAKSEADRSGDSSYKGRLGKLRVEDVLFINSKLRDYDAFTDKLEAFIHM